MALRFIEWVIENPKGVIALPTGKTPEFFIKYLENYKEHWQEESVQKELKKYGITQKLFPETSGLKFVMLDEFFPISTSYLNSFTSYVQRHYLKLLQIPSENQLLMDFSAHGIFHDLGMETLFPEKKVDISLLHRDPRTELEKLQKQALLEAEEFLRNYEKNIQKWGGIGFFIGGIGYDGHIAFNQTGSDLFGSTHLIAFNYQTTAHLASDMGGIENVGEKIAGTIGLGTISYNPHAVIIILSAGEGKAKIIQETIEAERGDHSLPATAFIGHSGARFYLSKGSATSLKMRKLDDMQKAVISDEIEDDVILEIALSEKTPIHRLTKNQINKDLRGQHLLNHTDKPLSQLLGEVKERFLHKMHKGINLPKGENILHTAPHHDDVMLSYYPVVEKFIKDNKHEFAYLTSGFTSVTDALLFEKIHFFQSKNNVVEKSYKQFLNHFAKAFRKRDDRKMSAMESHLFLNNLSTLYGVSSKDATKKAFALREELMLKYPGEKDKEMVQKLKGMIRESEVDKLWTLFDVPLEKVHHFRSKFYTGDYFTPLPNIEEDALPLYKLIAKSYPSIITVAFDPQGAGPDTHYKVLQIVAEALRITPDHYQPLIWGYRNVWYRFKPHEASLIVPVKEDVLKRFNEHFLGCFLSQRTASFPSHELDGPFSNLAESIQREQKNHLEILLGEDLPEAFREASGAVFIKEMSRNAFLQNTEKLKKAIE